MMLAQLTKLLLPTRCVLCQELGPEVLCRQCEAGLQPILGDNCMRCGRLRRTSFASPDCGECHGQTIGVIRARSAFVYNEPARTLLGEFKFHRHVGAGEELIARALKHIGGAAPEIYATPELKFDAIIPVPLHLARLRERRFNQSEFIANRLAKRVGAPCKPAWLRRERDTPTQVGLSANQRRVNVRGAFKVTAEVKGRTVLLVDDLMTTGSTLLACASALRRAGCRTAYGFTLFSTHHDLESPVGLL
jgi:ComF family protein